MKIIGITHTSFDQNFVRSQLFLFDKLLVLDMERAKFIGRNEQEEKYIQQERERTQCELDFLSDKGLIERIYPIQQLPEIKMLPQEIVKKFDRFSRYSDTWKDFVNMVAISENSWQHFEFGFCKSKAEALNSINTALSYQLRAHTLMANISNSSEFAFCSDHKLEINHTKNGQNDLSVASVILDKIPIIADMPYDEVIDFKKDPKTKHLHQRLKMWIAKFSTNDMDQKIMYAEMEQAIMDYRDFAGRQSKKQRLLQIELFLKVPIEFIESLVRIRPSRTINSIINIKRKKIELYESELEASGNQFAYIREIEQII